MPLPPLLSSTMAFSSHLSSLPLSLYNLALPLTAQRFTALLAFRGRTQDVEPVPMPHVPPSSTDDGISIDNRRLTAPYGIPGPLYIPVHEPPFYGSRKDRIRNDGYSNYTVRLPFTASARRYFSSYPPSLFSSSSSRSSSSSFFLASQQVRGVKTGGSPGQTGPLSGKTNDRDDIAKSDRINRIYDDVHTRSREASSTEPAASLRFADDLSSFEQIAAYVGKGVSLSSWNGRSGDEWDEADDDHGYSEWLSYDDSTTGEAAHQAAVLAMTSPGGPSGGGKFSVFEGGRGRGMTDTDDVNSDRLDPYRGMNSSFDIHDTGGLYEAERVDRSPCPSVISRDAYPSEEDDHIPGECYPMHRDPSAPGMFMEEEHRVGGGR